MPTVKIELSEGRNKFELIKIRDLVMDVVMEILRLPTDDRNVRLMEYQSDFFKMKPPYEMLIEISMFSGRTKETKKKLFRSIVEKLELQNLISKDKVLIILNEQPLENWGGRGGIAADEMDLEFNVNV